MVTQYYNLTNITNSSNFVQFTQNVSLSILGGYWLGLIIMLMVWGVFFFSLYGRIGNTAACFAVSSFIMAIVAMLLRSINLINDQFLWMAIIITGISIFFLFTKGAMQT